MTDNQVPEKTGKGESLGTLDAINSSEFTDGKTDVNLETCLPGGYN